MYFSRATGHVSANVRVVFVSLDKDILTYSIMITELSSSNMAEQQALILGLQMVVDIGFKYMTHRVTFSLSLRAISSNMKSRRMVIFHTTSMPYDC